MVAESAPSDVARAKPSSCPARAMRDLRVERIHSAACVYASARASFSGSRVGNPTWRARRGVIRGSTCYADTTVQPRFWGHRHMPRNTSCGVSRMTIMCWLRCHTSCILTHTTTVHRIGTYICTAWYAFPMRSPCNLQLAWMVRRMHVADAYSAEPCYNHKGVPCTCNNLATGAATCPHDRQTSARLAGGFTLENRSLSSVMLSSSWPATNSRPSFSKYSSGCEMTGGGCGTSRPSVAFLLQMPSADRAAIATVSH